MSVRNTVISISTKIFRYLRDRAEGGRGRGKGRIKGREDGRGGYLEFLPRSIDKRFFFIINTEVK